VIYPKVENNLWIKRLLGHNDRGFVEHPSCAVGLQLKGNIFTHCSGLARLVEVNQKLTDYELARACLDLLSKHPTLSCRRLRILLRERFGCCCRTDRVYAVWRSIRAEIENRYAGAAEPSLLGQELIEARAQIATLETALFDAENRAVRAEEREKAHQDRWAAEIHELRQLLQHPRQWRV
jgi:hypothetical protein